MFYITNTFIIRDITTRNDKNKGTILSFILSTIKTRKYKTEAAYYPPAGGGGRGLPRVRAGVRLRDGEALHAAAQHGGGLALRLGAQTQHRGQQNTRSVLHLSSSGSQGHNHVQSG